MSDESIGVRLRRHLWLLPMMVCIWLATVVGQQSERIQRRLLTIQLDRSIRVMVEKRPTMAVGDELRIRWTNNSFRALTGYTEHELIDQHAYVLMTAKSRQQHYSIEQNLTGEPRLIEHATECALITKSGAAIPVSLRVREIYSLRGPLFAVTVTPQMGKR
jgi:PAS domain S-box-containing protein